MDIEAVLICTGKEYSSFQYRWKNTAYIEYLMELNFLINKPTKQSAIFNILSLAPLVNEGIVFAI